jgi:hypothetical protein
MRHWPYNALDARTQRRVALQPLSGGGLHFVVFTCRKHLSLLRHALRSLLTVLPAETRRIHIIIDENDPFTTNDQRELSSLSPLITIREGPTFTGWGYKSVRIQFSCFARLSEQLSDNDYIIKMDSDLLFISPRIFDLALRSGADIVGDGRYVDFDYAQGGCFFMSKSVAQALDKYCALGAMERLLPHRQRPAEEEILREVLRRENANVWLTRFMMFPDEFMPKIATDKRFIEAERRRFSVLHFVKNKDDMQRVFRECMERETA